MAKRNGKRPNIIIFLMDTQGTINMSCYGYRRKTTPNIDALAKESCLFEQHFVSGSWTLPSHASMFTGRYESGHGAGAQHEGLEPGIPQMPETFSKNGYRTVAVNNNYWAVNKTNWSPGKGFDEVIHYNDPEIPAVAPWIPSDNPDKQDKGALKGIGVAHKWIEDNHVNGAGKPFMMYFNAYDIHDPFYPPEPWRSEFLLDGVKYEDVRQEGTYQNPGTIGDVSPTLDEWMALSSLKDANTAMVDDRVGQFVDALRANGVLDNTVFIITGDHGDCIGQHVGYAMHSQNGVYDHVCRTPLIVRYPKKFKPGSRCKELVQVTDIFPTMMTLAGIKDKAASESIAGKNLLDALKGPVRDFALIEAQRSIHNMRITWAKADDIENADVRMFNVWYKAARGKRYKFVWASNGDDRLYDIVKDPDERWNIIAKKPTLATKMRKALEAQLMSMEQRYYPDLMTPDRQLNYDPATTTSLMRRMSAWGFYQPGVVPAWNEKTQKAEIKKLAEWGKLRKELLKNTE